VRHASLIYRILATGSICFWSGEFVAQVENAAAEGRDRNSLFYASRPWNTRPGTTERTVSRLSYAPGPS